MGDLKQFADLKAKAEFFTTHKIDEKSDLDAFFKMSDSKSIWRGSPEAKYKLYTSLQRYWVTNNFPEDNGNVKDYLREIISNARNWNKGFLNKYFENYRLNSFSNYAVLSILRHHGTPTPLLDFTYNRMIALYFGAYTDGKESNSDDIDSYFSVYELKESHFAFSLDSKQHTYEYIKQSETTLREANRHHDNDPDFVKNFYQALINDDKTFFQTLDSLPIFKIQDLKEDEVFYYIKNNYNITNQEGLFVANLYPTKPFEEALIDRIRESALRVEPTITQIVSVKDKNKNGFHCYDINKKLKDYILMKLNEDFGINKNFVFPDLEILSSDCYRGFKING